LKSGTVDVTKLVQSIDELKSGTIDVAKTVQTVDEIKSGTIDVTKTVQTINELKSGTIDVSGAYGIDAGGTIHQIRVDSADGRLQNYVVEPGGALVDTRNIRYLTQDDVLGTVTQIKKPRKANFGTIASAFPCDGASQVPGTADVRTLDGFSLGMDADGTVEVSHQIQMSPGGSWREDGLGTLVTNEERITTINHKGLQYRPSLTNKDASSTVTVNVDWFGN